MDQLWRASLRRFDLEHTFRMLKQTLGWTAPKLRESAAADRWTWLVIAAHTQLRLARPLAVDGNNTLSAKDLGWKIAEWLINQGHRVDDEWDIVAIVDELDLDT